MKKNPFIARLAILTFTLVASSMPLMAQEESMGIHQALKTKFVEGNAGFYVVGGYCPGGWFGVLH